MSGKKKRLVVDDFDLDLTYITDRIIAMGYPAKHMEGMYRNKFDHVEKFFRKNHPNEVKVYNLCVEKDDYHTLGKKACK